MIELSLGKMVLLALIALIVLGPEKLPGAARTAGALLRRVRSGWDNVKAEVERELEIEEIKRSARAAVASAEAAQQHVKDTLKEAHDPFAEAAAMVKLSPPSDAAPSSQDASPAQRQVTNEHPQPGIPSTTPDAETSGERAVDHDEALEGVQAELPLDEPPLNTPTHVPAHDRDVPHDRA